MPHALEVERLSVAFGKRRVLDELTFQVETGTCLAVIGPNGSGKTVLLKALIGTLPAEGVIRWAPGTRIGYVPQKLDIERDLPLTGLDVLGARARVSRAPAGEESRARRASACRPPTRRSRSEPCRAASSSASFSRSP